MLEDLHVVEVPYGSKTDSSFEVEHDSTSLNPYEAFDHLMEPEV